MPSAEQTIRFAKLGGRRVAWASVGDGPPLLVGGWWMSHLELDWADPAFRAFALALAEHRTLIRYDRPGTGLSADEEPMSGTLDEESELLGAVAGEAADGPVAILGASSGGTVSAALAAAAPERVTRLVLYGSYADGSRIGDATAHESMVAMVRAHWGLGSRVLADVFLPGSSAEERDEFSRFQREAASAEVAARSLETVYRLNATDRLSEISAPTQVLHRREDRAIPFALGRELAAGIPGASFVALEGADHFPWRGATAEVLRHTLSFLGVREQDLPEPVTDPSPDVEPADADLSERELEVLKLIAQGLSDREIAEELVLSPHTVHRHVANIRAKLRLPSRAAAAAQAARMGLL